MATHILVPLDGSPFGEQAIPTALGLARTMGAPIELVLVQEPLVIPEAVRLTLMRNAELHEELRSAGASYLDMVSLRLREEGDVPVMETLLSGPVVETLADHIAEGEPHVVVMATHGRGGLSRAWLGSVADALVRRSAAPVLLVRPREDLISRAGVVPLDVVPSFARIAVPLDGSALAEQAVDEVLRMAGGERLELTLLQVVPPPVTYLRPSFTPDVSAELLAELEAESQRYLDRVSVRVQRPGLTIRTRVFVDVNAARGILAYAAGGTVDLIAMTTHARRGLARLVVGSVADKVVRGSVVPVMLLRPQELVREAAARTMAAKPAHVALQAPLPPL